MSWEYIEISVMLVNEKSGVKDVYCHSIGKEVDIFSVFYPCVISNVVRRQRLGGIDKAISHMHQEKES